MKDCDGDDGDCEKEIVGVSLAWLTRMKLPSEGEMEEKVTFRLMLGVKFSGMIFDGRRLALFSEETSVSVAIIRDVVVTSGTKYRLNDDGSRC